MKTDTSSRIITYIKTNHQARPADLVRHLGLSQVAIHKQLHRLLVDQKIVRIGRSPRVYYALAVKPIAIKSLLSPDPQVKKMIDHTYLYISPTGELLYGWPGFVYWAGKTHQTSTLTNLAAQYAKTRTQANQLRNDDILDFTPKLRDIFKSELAIKKVCGLDFYSLPVFGKTRLGSLVLHAKQSQSRTLISQIATEIRSKLLYCLKKYRINAVCYIPHSVPRSLQFLKEIELILGLPLPHVRLQKAYVGEVIVAQKSLSSLEERVINARQTIILENTQVRYSRVLVIDDALGSGSTLNETAKKLKLHIADEVYGFAIVGSLKGFDIIREA